MSRTIAEVLTEHQQATGHRDMKVHCWCGWSADRADGAFIAHQADTLSAAGFGDVREQQARLTRVEAELAHAEMNGHVLDGDSQGVSPGERVPAVRIAYIRAALTATEGAE